MAKCAICKKNTSKGLVIDKDCMDRIIILLVPIGGKIFMPYEYLDDGTIEQGVEELTLCGYINNDGNAAYLTFDNGCLEDIPVNNAYLTYEEAFAAL